MAKRTGEAMPSAPEPVQTLEATTSEVETGRAIGPAIGVETKQISEKTQAEVKATMDKAMKTAEELVTFGQGNLEAMVKSGQIWAAGVQDLSKTVAATAQAQMDETMATVKALSGVKSLKEAMELQTTLARSAMEKVMAETGKLTDASMKLAEQAWAPLTARMTLAVEKFSRTA